MISSWKVRLKAALWHLFISAVVVCAVGLWIFMVWFPVPYRDLSGGRQLWLILAAVDVTIGPLLTFFVFNPKKNWRSLRMDLGVIAALQLAALGYGLWTVAQARPVFLVHEVDRFRVITPADVNALDLNEAAPPLNRFPLWGIGIISAREASSPEERIRDIESALQGADISTMPKRWEGFGPAQLNKLQNRSLSVGKFESQLRDKSDVPMLQTAVREAEVPADQLLAVPVVGRNYATWTALVDKNTANIRSYAPIDYFEALKKP